MKKKVLPLIRGGGKMTYHAPPWYQAIVEIVFALIFSALNGAVNMTRRALKCLGILS